MPINYQGKGGEAVKRHKATKILMVKNLNIS